MENIKYKEHKMKDISFLNTDNYNWSKSQNPNNYEADPYQKNGTCKLAVMGGCQGCIFKDKECKNHIQ
jgi:hypothetical protein